MATAKTMLTRAEELLSAGYSEVSAYNELTVGARIRRYSQQSHKAMIRGTGNIERIFVKEKGFWVLTYGQTDVELIIKNDHDSRDDYSVLADYHITLIEE